MKYVLLSLLTVFSVSVCAAPSPADQAAKEKAKQEAKAAAEKQKALQNQARAECAKVSSEMEALAKEIPVLLKKNELKTASGKADRLILLSQFIGCDGKTAPRFSTAYAFEHVILPGFSAKKLSGADYTVKYYEQYFALLKKAGKPLPYRSGMAHITFLDTYALADRSALKKMADDAVAEHVKAPGVRENERDREIFRTFSDRACMFDCEDFDRCVDQADKLAGNDKAKRILFYQAFFAQRTSGNWTQWAGQKKLKAMFLEDKLLTKLDRALLFNTQYTFAEQEALCEDVLKMPGLSESDHRAVCAKIVTLERSGMQRAWLAESPMRFAGGTTVNSPDPICYAKAKSAQQYLIDTFKPDPDEKKKEKSLLELNKLYLDMLKLNFDGQNYADLRKTAGKLEKALPGLKDKWRTHTTGYLAASAYFEENFETAYKLFTGIPADEYRKDKELWSRIVEPYLRTCVAVKHYDEAYLLSPDIIKYVTAYWEYWQMTRYRRMFAELAKLCKPETVEAVKNATRKK